jgi:hypothetical protein
VLVLNLPACDIAKLQQIMDTIRLELDTLEKRDNVEHAQLLVEYGLTQEQRTLTLEQMIEQGCVIHECNVINEAAFTVLSDDLARRQPPQELTSEA